MVLSPRRAIETVLGASLLIAACKSAIPAPSAAHPATSALDAGGGDAGGGDAGALEAGPGPSAAPLETPASLCAKLATEQQKVLTAWDGLFPVQGTWEGTHAMLHSKAFTTCEPFADGVAGVLLSPPPAVSAKDTTPSATWSIVYLGRGEARSETVGGEASAYCYDASVPIWHVQTMADGTPWLATQLYISCPDGEGYDTAHMSHLVEEKLSPVSEVETKLGTFGDQDKDGLIDILFDEGFKGRFAACASLDGDWPWHFGFVQHGRRDGTFVNDDALAKAYFTKEHCPAAPKTIVMPKDPAQTLTNLACARFWGKSARELEPVVATFCRGVARTCRCKEPPKKEDPACCESELACRSPICATEELAKKILTTPLPFQLP